ncbi:MAG TPA: hypothetical protein VG318_09260 [Actinomycetota bacterium]|nr:hypothetical protein [Actinomycetota bacterium]
MHAHLRVDEDSVRRWLAHLRRPDRLDDPALVALLAAHGRAAEAPGLRTGRAAAELLREKIDALRPPEGAPAHEALPHRVLTACFVEGRKSFQAAALLGLSERQISRERSRAIALLAAELRSLPPGGAFEGYPAELLPRPDLTRRLDHAVRETRRVHVTGAAGAGKTALAGAWALRCDIPVFRHAFATALGDGAAGLLLALGEDLAPGDASLDNYMRAALPRPDLGLAARIALAALRRESRVLVLDDYDAAAGPPVEGFLGAVARLPSVRVVTIGRRPRRDVASVVIPSLSEDEVTALLQLRGVDADVARRLHALTGGNARMVDTAAAWLTRAAGHDALVRAAAGEAAARTAARLIWSARGRAA